MKQPTRNDTISFRTWRTHGTEFHEGITGIIEYPLAIHRDTSEHDEIQNGTRKRYSSLWCITHIPTGIVVECQEERSQHKNRAKAMSFLASRLQNEEIERQQKTMAATRKSLVGSGDRSERIRTYNFPQGRVTDHRINLTLYKLDEVISGDLDAVIMPLQQEHQADLLASLADD